MVMETERSKSLHNFTLPCNLKWGNQRFLRCMKVDSHGDTDRRPSSSALEVDGSSIERCQGKTTVTGRERLTDRGRERRTKPKKDGGIEEVRAKLKFDFQTAANKMKDAIFREGLEEKSQPTIVTNAAEADTMVARPWNLRTRHSACKTRGDGEDRCGCANGLKVDAAPRPTPSPAKRQRAEFSVFLLKHEIEEDFMAIVGRQPPRRPKKLSKNVQKELDIISISGISFDGN